MPKQKTSYPASRAAVEERPSGGKSGLYAGTAGVGAMPTRVTPEPEIAGPPGVLPSEPSPEVVPREAKAAGVWQRNKRVSALWGTNESRNSWVLISGLGWKKLSATSDSAALALTVLAGLGKLTQARVDYREESDGYIHELYVW